MAQLKANFRQGQQNYNRLINTYKKISKHESTIERLLNNRRKSLEVAEHFNGRAQNAGNNRQRNLYMSKARRSMKTIEKINKNIEQIKQALRALKREAIRFHGTNRGLTNNQINQIHISTNFNRIQKVLRLGHALNKFLTKPGTPPKMSYIQRKNWKRLQQIPGITAPRVNAMPVYGSL